MASVLPPKLTNHLIHPCTLALTEIRIYRPWRSCARCRSYRVGKAFSCKPCRFCLHVKCASDSIAKSEEAKEIQHFSHPHPLSLIQNHQQYGNEPRCAACLQTCLPPTPTFRSCAVNFPHQPRLHDHPLHPEGSVHHLTITSLKFRTPTCGACCWDIHPSLFAYSCPAYTCKFTLHLDCAKLSPSFACKGHPHLLIFLEKTPGFLCHRCGVKCTTFVLRCVRCNFNIHLQCLPSAPRTITHKSHLHPLVLTKSPFDYELNSEEDAYNSDDEFYCDVCEEKRFKNESVYYCAECKFLAELKCVISKVGPLISIGNATLQTRILSNDGDEEEVEEEENDEVDYKISKAIYELEELEQEKNKLEKSLESVERDIEKTKNMFDKLVKHASP